MSKTFSAHSTLGHYRIVSKLGVGGMGEVWLAEDTRLDRKVALKLLPAEFTQDAGRLRRFTQEAKAASALNHPNIISVYDIGECETGRFIVMELVSGRTLRSVIASDNSLDTFFALGHQMVRALSAAHAAGITHRDIKPDNIMVRDDGYVKILDFGLARLLPTTASDPEAATLAQQTTPGTVMGTLAYMSPEQASGQTVGSASDVFALGIVLYELATGRHPFKSETMIGYLHAITSQVPPSMTSLKSHLPAALDDLILRMLEKDAKSRPTASEVAQALQEIEKYGTSKTLPLRVVTAKEKATLADEGFWIAVLPFKGRDSDTSVAALADGLSEEIVTGLSRFRYLSVVASDSADRLKEQSGDEQALRAKLGARYVLEGSIRKGGSAIRVSTQLVDSQTGTQLWAESYNHDLETSSIFAVQDDLAARIVATVADSYGVLVHSMRDSIRQKDDADLTSAEWQFQYFAYREQITPTNHSALKSRLERAAKSEKRPSDLWACLAQVYLDEYAFGFPGHDENSLDRALVAARRAVELDRANQFAMVALAQTHFFRQDLAAFGPAAERAMALNPLNTDALGILGLEIVHTAEFERGTAIVRHAMELNPNHAGWMHFAPLWNHFHKGEYEQALECANRVDVPGLFWPYLVMASACGHLGRRIEAAAAVRDLLALDPEFAAHARTNVGTWHFASGLMEPILEGLRKAGLEISEEAPASTSSARSLASSETRTDEGFWVAVLPFKFTGSNTEVSTLAEGLSEEIITGLSRFSYLRVISRSSTLRYANETGDVREVGKKLGARYVMEGSLRLAGASLRISVQLIDASTGVHLWAETYNRQFRPDEVFALQDDLVPRIVSTIADVNGVLPRSMCDVVCSKNPDELSVYEAVLRSFRYFDRVTGEELAAAQSCLEIAVQKAPNNSDAWAMLALLFAQDYGQGFNLNPDALNSATRAAQRAVEAGPSNHLAHFSLAQARFFQKDTQSFRNAAERTVALNPMDANSLAFMGELLTYVGDSEHGLALATRAKGINPNHPGWFWYADFFHAYRQGDYRGALALVLKANLPGHWGMHAGIAAAAGQLGEKELAAKAIRDLLKLRPDYGATVHNTLAKWFDPELCEQLLDGLRTAGLEISDHEKLTTSSTVTETAAEAEFSPSIAVLPFVNISNDPDNDYFCDGLAEELLNALTKIDHLKVAARTSAFSFKGKNTGVSEIGQRLGVKTVLEGSVRRSGSRLRITVQLVNASDGYHLWSERYDREMRDIFDVQDEITLAVVDALKLKLFSDEKAVVLKRYTDNVEAHELFLKGRYYHYKYSAEGWRRAIEFFERAIEKEPNYAPAYAGMNTSLGFLWFLGFLPAEQAVPQMRAAAIKALEIDGNLADAHLSQAMISFFYDWEWQKAEQEFKRAIALDPHNAEALSFYAMFLGFEERFTEAIDQGERALAIDPLSTTINMNVGWTFFSAGLVDKTLNQVDKMIEVEPDFYGSYWLRGAIYLSEGEYDNAVNDLKKAVSLGGRQIVLADLGGACGLAGKNDEATAILDQLLEMRKREYVPAICMARIYCRIGENDKAIEWLEKAFEERNGEMVFLKSEIAGAAKGDSLNSLGSDARLIKLLLKMRLP